MTLLAINGQTSIDRECDICGSVDTINIDELVAGRVIAGVADVHGIDLPPCAICLAGGIVTKETLFEEPDDVPTSLRDVYNTDQHGAINGLRSHLIARGKFDHRLSKDQRDAMKAERRAVPKRFKTLSTGRQEVLSNLHEFRGLPTPIDIPPPDGRE